MVSAVGYPELEHHPSHALAKTTAARGCGAVFSFDLKGSRQQGIAFIEALKLFSHLANVGDCRSLVIHPGLDDALPHGRRGARRRPASGRQRSACRSAWKTPDDLIDDLKRA